MTSPIPVTTEQSPARENSPPGRRLPWSARLFTRLSRRGLPPPVCAVRVAAGIDVPAADGVPLRTDHYIPQLTGPRPALLVRTPYGRGFPWAFLFGGLFAERGYHVIIQSCRGTGGSGGSFQPWRHEQADGQAAVAWLRQQDWFTGELATIGPSYLGYTQWALAADPPPELRAMIVQVGASAPYPLFYPGGAFALENMLIAVVAMRYWERGFGAVLRALLRLQTRIGRATRTLPVLDAYPKATGGRIGYFEEWLTHPDADDPYWTSLDAAADAPAPTVPVSLLTGWQDICLDQNLAEYRRLRAAGRTPRLIIGPWSHASGFNDDLPIVVGEALDWLTAHCSKDPAGWTRPPVRVHVGGGRGEWRDLADWPPPQAAGQLWRLAADGQLSAGPPARPGVSSLRYDPADPTPSVGGQLLSNKAGARDNRALEARADVLVFTSPPLPADLDVIGPVSARLRVRASGPHFDVFARLCDVDPRGRSRNVCDGLIRHDPSAPAGPDGADGADGTAITVPMSATAYRFRAGHRLRLQVSGGAHPRFARNTGTGEPPATATRLAAVDLAIVHDAADPGGLTLPVLG